MLKPQFTFNDGKTKKECLISLDEVAKISEKWGLRWHCITVESEDAVCSEADKDESFKEIQDAWPKRFKKLIDLSILEGESNMKLKKWNTTLILGNDKIGHFLVGTGISTVMSLLPFNIPPKGILFIVLLVAIAKELRDSLPSNTGCPDVWDMFATVLGGVVGLGVWYLISGVV